MQALILTGVSSIFELALHVGKSFVEENVLAATSDLTGAAFVCMVASAIYQTLTTGQRAELFGMISGLSSAMVLADPPPQNSDTK